MADNLDFYDLVIDVDSFDDLKNKDKGWQIEMDENGENKYNFYTNAKDDEPDKQLNRIGILGASGVGKTFILGKLINKDDLIKNKIETKGISLIYPEIGSEKSFVCIDSQGSEEPIVGKMEKEEIVKLTDQEKKNLIKLKSKDKKFIEIFIQDFIIEKSNILIVVVDQLKFSEQKLINRLKNHSNFDKLFVIHNLQFFCDLKTINEHIENVIKKSVFSNLELRYIDYMDPNNTKKNDKPFFYYDNEIGTKGKKKNKNRHETIHLFMGKEDSPAGKYFNYETIKYITHLIKAETNKKIFDIVKEINSFLSLNSIQYMIKNDKEDRPIKEEDLKFESNESKKSIKCIKDFELKNCIVNEMGISSFSLQNSINPSYICYKGNFKKYKKQENKNAPKEIEEEWPALIVKTEMFVNPEEIQVFPIINDDYESMVLTITCPKRINKEDNIKEIEFLDGDIKEGEIRIDIKFNLEDIVLDPDTQFRVRETNTGILIIYLKIVDPNKAESVKKEIKSKKRNKKENKK